MTTALTTFFSLSVNGLVYGSILFLISAGLTVTLGLMRILNLAHCGFAMIGGYIAWVAMDRGAGFLVAVLIAVLATMVLGYALERTVYRWVYRASQLGQVLITIGLTFVMGSLINLQFGGLMKQLTPPSGLLEPLQLPFMNVQQYRLVLLVVAAVVALALWLGLERTSFGARLRAAVDNRRMAGCVGIDVDRVMSITFAIGCGLAALGGALGTQLLPLAPFYGIKHLVLVLIVVSVGGLGSLRGSLLAAMALAVIDTLGRFYFPTVGGFILFGVVLVFLLFRPQGLIAGAMR